MGRAPARRPSAYPARGAHRRGGGRDRGAVAVFAPAAGPAHSRRSTTSNSRRTCSPRAADIAVIPGCSFACLHDSVQAIPECCFARIGAAGRGAGHPRVCLNAAQCLSVLRRGPGAAAPGPRPPATMRSRRRHCRAVLDQCSRAVAPVIVVVVVCASPGAWRARASRQAAVFFQKT